MDIPIKQVKSISHDWKVKSVKTRGLARYYFLIDKNNDSIFNILKESIDPNEHFSGRILELEDYKRKDKRKVAFVNDKELVEWKIEEVPHIYKLMDVGIVTESEAKKIYGGDLRSFILTDGNIKENLFYKKKSK